MHAIDRRALAAAGLAIAATTAAAQPPAAEYELIFQDEFNAAQLNTDIWEPMIGDGTEFGIPGWGNNELQYYTGNPQNVSLDAGNLKITIRRQNLGGKQYTSARLRTINNLDFQYGYIEGRMKLPKGQGYWPAFWMLPTGSPYGGWAASGEIDIMEARNQMDVLQGTIHFGGPWPQNTSAGGFLPVADLSAGFNVYGLEWTPDELRWYFNGQLYHTLTANQWFSTAAPGNNRAPFDNPFHLLINCAVGGNYPGPVGGDTQFPQEMLVDWVRVYQLPGGVTPPPPPPPPPPQPEPSGELPSRVEAEDFDPGGQGFGYFDSDPDTNNGGAYRPDEGVDIQPSSQGGFNVGWLEQGEWLDFTLDVRVPGTYAVTASVASQHSGNTFRFTREGGAAYTFPISVPNTGGWQNWTTVTSSLDLERGVTTIRFEHVNDGSGGFNVDFFDFEVTDPDCLVDLAEPYGVVNFADVSAFIAAFNAAELDADVNFDGVVNFGDVSAFVAAVADPCE